MDMSIIEPLYNATIGPLLSDSTRREFFKVICSDDTQKLVSFEKFNRLCDLFFYVP